MKKTDKILLVILSLCLIIVIISSLSYVFKGNHGLSWELFYEYADDIDVLFLGNSHAADYVPMELWEQYGVTSYNLAISGIPIPVTYWTLMNALDHASPKLVVLDCYSLEYPNKTGMLNQKINCLTIRLIKGMWSKIPTTNQNTQLKIT